MLTSWSGLETFCVYLKWNWNCVKSIYKFKLVHILVHGAFYAAKWHRNMSMKESQSQKQPHNCHLSSQIHCKYVFVVEFFYKKFLHRSQRYAVARHKHSVPWRRTIWGDNIRPGVPHDVTMGVARKTLTFRDEIKNIML